MDNWGTWLAFGVTVLVMLGLDMFLAQRGDGTMPTKKALVWSGVWVAVGLLFNLFIYFAWGSKAAGEYLACYVVELALSVDNLFVFVIIFSALGIPATEQRRVLFWGIIGAWVTRGAFIVVGIELINHFAWTTYLLGGFLIYTGFKLLAKHGTDANPNENPILKFGRRYLRVTDTNRGHAFFVTEGGKFMATPLFMALLAVESTDIMFAVDSVPAALGITQSLPIVYTSNIMAVLGLRAMYFAIAGLLKYLRYLNYALAAILVFIGVKLVGAKYFHLPVSVSLSIVGGILALAVVASLVNPDRSQGEKPS